MMLSELLIFLALYAVLGFTDLVPVFKAKDKKALIFGVGVFAIAFVLQILIIFDVQLPRYADVISGIIKITTGYQGEA